MSEQAKPELYIHRWKTPKGEKILSVNYTGYPFIELRNSSITVDEQILNLPADIFSRVRNYYHSQLPIIELFRDFPASYFDCEEADYSHREIQTLYNSQLLFPEEHFFLDILACLRDKTGYYESRTGFKFHPISENFTNTYTYLMVDERSNLIKIGKSDNPKYRESTLQSEQPLTRLIFAWKTASDEETKLHSYFAKKRVRGEWFRLEPLDIAFVISEALKNRKQFIEPDEYLEIKRSEPLEEQKSISAGIFAPPELSSGDPDSGIETIENEELM
jgi:hypothetical protein